MKLDYAVSLTDDIGYPHTKVLVDNNDFTFSDQLIVNQDVDRLTGKLVQFDDRSLRQFKDLLDQLLRSAKLHRYLERNIQQQIKIGAAVCGLIRRIQIRILNRLNIDVALHAV